MSFIFKDQRQELFEVLIILSSLLALLHYTFVLFLLIFFIVCHLFFNFADKFSALQIRQIWRCILLLLLDGNLLRLFLFNGGFDIVFL